MRDWGLGIGDFSELSTFNSQLNHSLIPSFTHSPIKKNEQPFGCSFFYGETYIKIQEIVFAWCPTTGWSTPLG